MLREGWYNIRKTLFFNTVIVLQFSCFFWLFSVVLTYYFNISTATWIQNTKKGYQYYTLYESGDNEDISDDPMMASNIKAALDEVYRMTECTYMAVNRNAGGSVPVEVWEEHFKGEGYEQLLEDAVPQETSDGILVVSAYLCRMDKNAVKHYIPKVADGRCFQDEDFRMDIHDTEVPVLLGAEYSGHFEVGEMFYLRMTKPLTARVIGFLPENTLYVSDSTAEHRGYEAEKLDCSIILPYFDVSGAALDSTDRIFLDENYYNYLQGTLLMDASVSKMEAVRIQEKINEIFVKNNLYTVTAQNASKGMRLFQKETRESVNLILGLIIIMAVFNVFSLCMSLINKLNMNMNRYAVQLMNGQKPQRILCSYLFEIVVLIGIAVGLTGYKLWHEITCNMKFLWLLLGITMLTMLPCVIVLCCKMYSVDMEALLRRKEVG